MANEKLINSRVQLKIDSDSNWARATTFIPKDGEPIIYSTDNDIVRIKIGDGSTAVNDLQFINVPYRTIITEPNTEVYEIVDEWLKDCWNQHVLLRDGEHLYLVYFSHDLEHSSDPVLRVTCLDNGGHQFVIWTEEVAYSPWIDFQQKVWKNSFQSIYEGHAAECDDPFVLCKPYSQGENGYVGHIQETTVQYQTVSGDFPKVTTSNNQSITTEKAFLSHFDTGLSEQVTITDLLNVYSLYYADTCSGMRLGSSKNVGSITITCPHEFEIRYISYFSYNSSTGEIVGQDDSWISIDGNKSYLGVGASGSVTFTGGTHTISTCVDENGTHQGRIIITGFSVMSSSEPVAEYTYHELARLEDITAEIDDLVDNTLASMQQEINDIRVDDIQQDQTIKELQNTLGTTQIYDVKSSLPKAGPEHLDGKIFQFKDNLYKCIANGEGDNQEYSLALAGTSEITVAQLTQENSPVYGELGKVFKKNVEIATTLTKVFRNNDSIKLGSSSATGSITFMSLHNLPVNKVTIGLKAYNTKGSSFNIEDDWNNIYYVDIPAGNTDEVLFSMTDDDNSDKLVNFTISSLAEANHDKRGCITRLMIDYGNITYEWKNLTAGNQSQISITWQELKDLRDNSLLVPGMQYRITDYECRTATYRQGRYTGYDITKPENHRFDIIVEAISNSVLSEDAHADYHYGPNGELDGYFQKLSFNSDAIDWQFAFRLTSNNSLSSEAYNWTTIDMRTNDKGQLVPVLTIDERPVQYTEYYYEREYAFNDETYLLWRVIEDASLDDAIGVEEYYTWDDTNGIKYILTNKVDLTDLSAVDADTIQVYYAVYDDANEGGRYVQDEIVDTFVAGGYRENLNGDVVPVLWKTDLNEYTEPDYNDTYYYVGNWEYAGDIYDRWDKIEGNQAIAAGYALTNVIVKNNKFIPEVLGIQKIANVPAWTLKYCLDNDVERFNWAANGKTIKILDNEGDIWTRDNHFDDWTVAGNEDWTYSYVLPMNNNVIRVMSLGSMDLHMVEHLCGEPHAVLETDLRKNEDTGEWEAFGGGTGYYTFQAAWEEYDQSLEGRGVIYNLVDEFNNECDWDFKNITFRPEKADYDILSQYYAEAESLNLPEFLYTFHHLANEYGDCASTYIDASMKAMDNHDDALWTVYDNKISAWRGWSDEGFSPALILPACSIMSSRNIPIICDSTIISSYRIYFYEGVRNKVVNSERIFGVDSNHCEFIESLEVKFDNVDYMQLSHGVDINFQNLQSGGSLINSNNITYLGRPGTRASLYVGGGNSSISIRDEQPKYTNRTIVIEPGARPSEYATNLKTIDISADYDDYQTVIISNNTSTGRINI